MFGPLTVALGSLIVSGISLIISWRAYRVNTGAQRHAIAAAKAVAAQRLTTVLDWGLKLLVVDLQTIAEFPSDTATCAGMARSAAEAVDDVARAFPHIVQHIDELRRDAEVGAHLCSKAELTNEELTALVWHYDRIYLQLWVLSAYALQRRNPTGTKDRPDASRDKYFNAFSARQHHFQVVAYKTHGLLPADYQVPPVDASDRRAIFEHRPVLEKLRNP